MKKYVILSDNEFHVENYMLFDHIWDAVNHLKYSSGHVYTDINPNENNKHF